MSGFSEYLWFFRSSGGFRCIGRLGIFSGLSFFFFNTGLVLFRKSLGSFPVSLLGFQNFCSRDGPQHTALAVSGIIGLGNEYQLNTGLGNLGLLQLSAYISGIHIFEIGTASAFRQGEGGVSYAKGNGEAFFAAGLQDLLGRSCQNFILEACGEEGFTISFGVADSTFPLPEGRCRA